MTRYDDIIALPYKKSTRHTPMPEADRAAQFAPFAALKGYEDEIGEEILSVDERILLDEGTEEEIDAALRLLSNGKREATVTFFLQHERKEGGVYVTESGICRVDPIARILFLDEKRIPFADILYVEVNQNS